MKKLIIDLCYAENPSNLIPVLKAKIISEEDKFFHVVGYEKDLLTITGLKNVETSLMVDGEEKESALEYEFKLLGDKNQEYSSLLTLAPLELVSRFANNMLTLSSKKPGLIRLFPSLMNGNKKVIPTPIEYGSPSFDDFISLKELGSDYFKKEGKEEFKFALLSSEKEKTSPIYLALDDNFKKEKGYLGLLNFDELLDSQADMLLIDPVALDIYEEGIRGGSRLAEKYVEVNAANASFQYKFGSFFMRGVFDNFRSSLDRNKGTSEALFFGYEKDIIISYDSGSLNSFKDCLERL